MPAKITGLHLRDALVRKKTGEERHGEVPLEDPIDDSIAT